MALEQLRIDQDLVRLWVPLVVQTPDGVDQGLLVPTHPFVGVAKYNAGLALLAPWVHRKYRSAVQLCSVDLFLNPLAVVCVHSARNDNDMRAPNLIEDRGLKGLRTRDVVNWIALRNGIVAKV